MKTKKKEAGSRWVSGDRFQFNTPKTPKLRESRRKTTHGGVPTWVHKKQIKSSKKILTFTPNVSKSNKKITFSLEERSVRHLRSRVMKTLLKSPAEGQNTSPIKRVGGEMDNVISPKKAKLNEVTVIIEKKRVSKPVKNNKKTSSANVSRSRAQKLVAKKLMDTSDTKAKTPQDKRSSLEKAKNASTDKRNRSSRSRRNLRTPKNITSPTKTPSLKRTPEGPRKHATSPEDQMSKKKNSPVTSTKSLTKTKKRMSSPKNKSPGKPTSTLGNASPRPMAKSKSSSAKAKKRTSSQTTLGRSTKRSPTTPNKKPSPKVISKKRTSSLNKMKTHSPNVTPKKITSSPAPSKKKTPSSTKKPKSPQSVPVNLSYKKGGTPKGSEVDKQTISADYTTKTPLLKLTPVRPLKHTTSPEDQMSAKKKSPLSERKQNNQLRYSSSSKKELEKLSKYNEEKMETDEDTSSNHWVKEEVFLNGAEEAHSSFMSEKILEGKLEDLQKESPLSENDEVDNEVNEAQETSSWSCNIL